MKVIPATNELIRDYYGEQKIPSMRSYMLMDGDTPIGMAGFIRMARNKMFVVTEAKEGVLENNRITVMKFAKMMTKIADNNGWDLVAVPDPDIPNAKHFLVHLGFENYGDGEYIRWAQ